MTLSQQPGGIMSPTGMPDPSAAGLDAPASHRFAAPSATGQESGREEMRAALVELGRTITVDCSHGPNVWCNHRVGAFVDATQWVEVEQSRDDWKSLVLGLLDDARWLREMLYQAITATDHDPAAYEVTLDHENGIALPWHHRSGDAGAPSATAEPAGQDLIPRSSLRQVGWLDEVDMHREADDFHGDASCAEHGCRPVYVIEGER